MRSLKRLSRQVKTYQQIVEGKRLKTRVTRLKARAGRLKARARRLRKRTLSI